MTRTREEEELVGWMYYLNIVAVELERHRPESWDLLVKHGYRDPTEVVREIEAALRVQREAKYPIPTWGPDHPDYDEMGQ